MTELTIAICADDDRAALRVLRRMVNMMPWLALVRGGGDDILRPCGYTVGDADGSGTATVRRTRDGVGPVADGGGIQPREVWIVLWHDEGRGDRNVGVHGVFDDATMAHDEAHKMNRESSYLYWPVNYMVTPAKNPLDSIARNG